MKTLQPKGQNQLLVAIFLDEETHETHPPTQQSVQSQLKKIKINFGLNLVVRLGGQMIFKSSTRRLSS